MKNVKLYEKNTRKKVGTIALTLVLGATSIGFSGCSKEKAIKTLQELYPDRKIEPIYAREILLGGGNIHCITQQVPKTK